MAEPALDSNSELLGLSPAEVVRRREQDGVNELPTSGGHGLLVDILNHPFRFAPLGPLDVALCFGAGSLSVAWFEIVERNERSRPALPPAGNPAAVRTSG